MGNYDHNYDIHYANFPFISCHSLFANFRTVEEEVFEEKENPAHQRDPSSNFSKIHDKLSHFCDKNLLNSCCTGAIKEDLQSCSSLIVILRVSWGEKFTKGNKSSNISSKPLSNYFKTNYLNALNFINTSSLLYFFSASFPLDKLLNKITILNSILLNSLNEYSTSST